MVFGSSRQKRPPPRHADFVDDEELEEVYEVGDDNVDVDHVSETQEEDVTSEAHQNTQSGKGKGAYNDKPLYDEVTLIGAGNSKNASGTKVWVCNHCKGQFTSSYIRMHTHFLGAPVGKKADIKRCPALVNDIPTLRRVQQKVRDAEKQGLSKTLKTSVVTKKPNTQSKKPLEDAFRLMDRKEVDLKIVRALCVNGIPFNVLGNPQFREMVTALRKAPEGYKAPSSEKARTTLLDECARDVEKDLIGFKDTWYTQGVSIVSDGWSNVKREPLLNVVAVNSHGAMFMYSEVYLGVEKTGKAIAEFLNRAIESVGRKNVLSVVTDNAANCKAAGKEVEKVHKHIFWSPCCVHTLNLIFKDFDAKFLWLHDTYKRGKTVVKYFLNHGQALATFRENSKLQLLRLAKTRFASCYIVLRRLKTLREVLSTTIALNSWRDRVKHGDEKVRLVAQQVVETIRDDTFWEDVDEILKIKKPIYMMIKFCDGEGPKMGEIYERMDNMLGEIKEAIVRSKFEDSFDKVEDIVLARWEKMTIPLHCLGFALNPRFYNKDYLEGVAPGGFKRKAPNLDKEVVEGVLAAFARISDTKDEDKLLREQFAKFHMKKGLYSSAGAVVDAATMDAIDWWSTYGAETPDLAEVAKKVLSQPISSSSAERNWSTYSFIHNVKRNRLTPDRAEKCVYVHSNIRLCSRLSESYTEGAHKNWDVDPESINMEPSSVDDMMWWDALEEDEDNATGMGKRQRVE